MITGTKAFSLVKGVIGHEEVKAFNEKYNIFRRSTQYTPRDLWAPCSLVWCLERDYSSYEKNHKVPWIEVCVQPYPGQNYPAWFIWNGPFGINTLVLEERQ